MIKQHKSGSSFFNEQYDASIQPQQASRQALRHFSVPVLSIALFILLTVSSQPARAANSYYISKNGNNADGLTWQTAWNELNQVKWTGMPPNSTINIDGGTSGMTYTTTLTDDATTSNYANNITIAQSTASGHNGKVTITGNGTNQYGIYLNGVSVIQVTGNGPVISGGSGGMEITNERVGGLGVVNSNACIFSLLDIDNNVSNAVGVYLYLNGGTQFDSFQNMQIHDNPTNVIASTVNANSKYYGSSFMGCAIYNTTPPANGQIILSNGSFSFQFCSIGPYVDTIIQGGAPGGVGVGASDSFNETLFVQPKTCALQVGGVGNVVTLSQVTSFMTALSQNGYALYFLLEPTASNTITVNTSTIYGGSVSVPAGTNLSASNSNWQYLTTGNTTSLGTNVGNPKTQQPFSTNVTGYNNSTTAQTLMNTNFMGASTSPMALRNSWWFMTINMLIQYGVSSAG